MVGKLLGALIGGALGLLFVWSPVLAAALAVVGAFLGHVVVDREVFLRPQLRRAALEPTLRDSAAYIDALCPLLMEVAKADGPVVQSEIRVIRVFFEQQLPRHGLSQVRAKLKEALLSGPQDVEMLATRARAVLKPSLRAEVVRALYELSIVDGDIQRSEHEQIRRIVNVFNLSEEQLVAITSKYFGSGEEAFLALGLMEQATDDEVKSAFRRLAVECHPDRTRDGGQRFREVKEAYETIKKLRAF